VGVHNLSLARSVRTTPGCTGTIGSVAFAISGSTDQ
jgi:hypothetical protein